MILLPAGIFSPGLAQPGGDTAAHYMERALGLYDRSIYDSLPWYYTHARTLYEEAGDREGTAACMLGMAEYYRLTLGFERAGEALDASRQYILEYIGRDSETWSDALYLEAMLEQDRSNFSSALGAGEACLALRQGLGCGPEKIARTYNMLGQVYYLMGDYADAEQFYDRSLQLLTQQESGPTVEIGWVLNNLGLVYGRMRETDKWLEFIKRAIENNKALYGEDFADLANSYISLANYYISRGGIDSANLYLDRAEATWTNAYGGDYFKLFDVFINRARILNLEGNYYTALEYYREAERIQELNRYRQGYNSFILNVNTGNLYRKLGEYEMAGKYYGKLLDAGSSMHPSRKTVVYHKLAISQTSLGDFRLAGEYFQRLFTMRDEYFPEDHYGRANDLRAYGELLDSMGRYGEATRYFTEALEITEKNFGPRHPSTSLILKQAGDHFLRSGDPLAALDYYQQSLHSLVPGYDTADASDNPAEADVQDHLFLLGLLKQKAASLETLARNGDGNEELRAAFNAYRLCVRLTERLRTSYLNDRSKLFLSENERGVYEGLVRVAYALYGFTGDPLYMDEAFVAAEKSKYATLLSVLQRSDAIRIAGIPDSVRERESGLRNGLNVFRELLEEARGDTLVDSLKIREYGARVFALSDELEQLSKRMETDYPAYYNLLYDHRVTDIEDARKGLRKNERLVEYFMGAGNLYMFELAGNDSRFTSIPRDTALERDLKQVDEYLQTNYLSEVPGVSHEQFLEAANRLYIRLMPGVREGERILVIPEGRLAYLPFEILVTEPVTDFDGMFGRVPFLIREHPVRYAYSATLMNFGGRHSHGQAGKLVAFAPGYVESTVDTAGNTAKREVLIDRSELEPLPGTLREAEEIGAMTGGRSFTGRDASESRFKELGPGSSIIHLAAHAYLDDEDPLLSKLVFSEETGPDEDGFLNVYEIYNLELTAGMVVLSACNTGSGVLKGGEGIMSMARAFLYAGVPDIVMTLWTVSDKQSYRLMMQFYKHLLKGGNAPEALRRAKLDMLEGDELIYQHPRYWAGYISVGKPGVVFRNRFYGRIIAGILLASLLAAIPVIRAKRRKQGARGSKPLQDVT